MKHLWRWCAVALAWACGGYGGYGHSQSNSSVVLGTAIELGAGDLPLLKEMSGAQLEALRVANGNQLALGVDVREHVAGTESPSSQGVALQSAWLEVIFPGGVVKTYGNQAQTAFYSETQALLIPAGTTQRRSYFTLLGESGQTRKGTSNAIQAEFDSTLKIPVPDNLSQATAATVHVRLLRPDNNLRDPHAFYDFSDLPERVAVLNAQDAQYLDQVLPFASTFRLQAPAMQLSPQGQQTQQTLAAAGKISAPPESYSWLHQPGSNSYYQSAFDDDGDYDYNDAVVSYHYQLGLNQDGAVETITGMAYLIARGSNYSQDWSLDLPLPSGTQLSLAQCYTLTADLQSQPCQIGLEGNHLRWQAFSDTRTLLPGNVGNKVNTSRTMPMSMGPHAHYTVRIHPPIPLEKVGTALPGLYVRDTGQQLSAEAHDSRGYHPVIVVPRQWHVVQEGVDMGLAYPELSTFIGSSATKYKNWYLHPNPSLIAPWGQDEWEWDEWNSLMNLI